MVVRTAGGLPGVCPQDTYWCHTVSVFTAFSSNRIGEYDSPAVLTTASTVVLTGVPYTSELLEAVIILGQRTDREKTGQGVLRQRDPTGADHSKESRLRRKVVHQEHRLRARRNAS